MSSTKSTTVEGTPRTPSLHGRAMDVHFDDNVVLLDSSSAMYQASKWHIASAMIFVISSILYLSMACMVMGRYWFYRGIPHDVMTADDDSIWWNYFVNNTDSTHLPESVQQADDDYSWYHWYNETAFYEDDNIWLPKVVKNPQKPHDYVSKYMILYCLAAHGFMVVGLIELCLSRSKARIVQALYIGMFTAATFGFVSAILTNKNPFWSAIFNVISTNLWALEAVFIVAQRLQGTTADIDDIDDDYYEPQQGHMALTCCGFYYQQSRASICGWSIQTLLWIADASFLVGTLGDAISSYWYIYQYDNWILGILAIIFASFWQICALVYLAVAIYDWNQFKSYVSLVSIYQEQVEAKDLEVVATLSDSEELAVGTNKDNYHALPTV